MKFSLVLTIIHPLLKKPIEHVDMIDAESMAQAVKLLDLTGKEACDLKNTGKTQWKDENGAMHTLELTVEAEEAEQPHTGENKPCLTHRNPPKRLLQ